MLSNDHRDMLQAAIAEAEELKSEIGAKDQDFATINRRILDIIHYIKQVIDYQPSETINRLELNMLLTHMVNTGKSEKEIANSHWAKAALKFRMGFFELLSEYKGLGKDPTGDLLFAAGTMAATADLLTDVFAATGIPPNRLRDAHMARLKEIHKMVEANKIQFLFGRAVRVDLTEKPN